jgi:cytochrome c-type biogenesis protein CcmH
MAALTALVLGLLLRPLLRAPRAAVPEGGPDLAIYRDQLGEIERDRAAGRLPEAEAAVARREVERRLLRAADAAASRPQGAKRPPARRLAIALLLLVPTLGLGLYLLVGRPDLPAEPLSDRAAELADYHALTAEQSALRRHLQDQPEDALAWRRLGIVEILLGNIDQAVQAVQTALEKGAPQSETFTLVAQAIITRNGGAVPPMARQMLARALELDPNNWLALFLSGLALEQDGRGEAALELWRAILAEAGPDLPWRQALQAQIERLEKQLGAPAPAP